MPVYKNYYEIIGVSPAATLDQIKDALKTQSMKWHPDLNPDPKATQRMQEINEARRILQDPELKADYDRQLQNYQFGTGSQQSYQHSHGWSNSNFNSFTSSGMGDDRIRSIYEASVRQKNNHQLLHICADHTQYVPEFIGLVIMELRKRGFTDENIYAYINRVNYGTRPAAKPVIKTRGIGRWWTILWLLYFLYKIVQYYNG